MGAMLCYRGTAPGSCYCQLSLRILSSALVSAMALPNWSLLLELSSNGTPVSSVHCDHAGQYRGSDTKPAQKCQAVDDVQPSSYFKEPSLLKCDTANAHFVK
jgi:hypothetical protein